jgi:hypothetical protein
VIIKIHDAYDSGSSCSMATPAAASAGGLCRAVVGSRPPSSVAHYASEHPYTQQMQSCFSYTCLQCKLQHEVRNWQGTPSISIVILIRHTQQIRVNGMRSLWHIMLVKILTLSRYVSMA